jgi:outer membrane protein assembly factor BamB
MDIGFDFETGFEAELEDVEIKKVSKFSRSWNVKYGGSILTIPTEKNGVLIFSAADQYLYAVDWKTGEEIWRYRSSGIHNGSSPVIVGNKVIVGDFDCNVYSVDFNSGRLIWKFKTGGKIATTPVESEGIVYMGSQDGFLYALDLETGCEIWRFNTGDEIEATAAVYKDRVFTGSFNGLIFCLDKKSGEEIWRFKTGGEIINSQPFLVENSVLYFGSMDSYFYAVDVSGGKEIWRFRTGKYGNSGVGVSCEGKLYIACRDGIVYALDQKTGEESWRFRTSDAMVWQKPVVTDKNIFVGSEDGNLYALNLEGKEVWRLNTGVLYTTPLLYKGILYQGSGDCHLYAVDSKTGKEVWRFPTSTLQPSEVPPAYGAWKIEIKKETHIEEPISEGKYKKKKEETVSLSDYQIESEYSSEAEYKQKSDYDVHWVMFEGVLKGEELWISNSKDLKQSLRISR